MVDFGLKEGTSASFRFAVHLVTKSFKLDHVAIGKGIRPLLKKCFKMGHNPGRFVGTILHRL